MSQLDKNPIDELFKDSLGQREFEFDPAAWEEASALIDSAKGGSSLSLWKTLSITGGIVGGAMLFLLTCNPGSNTTATSIAEQTSVQSVHSTALSQEIYSTDEASNNASLEHVIANETVSRSSNDKPVANVSVLPETSSLLMSKGMRAGANTIASNQEEDNSSPKTNIGTSLGVTATNTGNNGSNANGEINDHTASIETGNGEVEKSNGHSSSGTAIGHSEKGAFSFNAAVDFLDVRKGHFENLKTPQVPNSTTITKPATVQKPLYIELNLFTNQWKSNASGSKEADKLVANSSRGPGYGIDASLMIPKGKFSVGGALGFERISSTVTVPSYDESTTSINYTQTVGTDSMWTPTSNTTGQWFTVYYNDSIQDTVTMITRFNPDATKITRITGYASALVAYHKNLGKWNVGIGAGPTLRYLFEQRGNYPSASSPDFEAIETQNFRELNFGLLVRPSMHYQWNEQFSLGASFTYHRSFMNTGRGPVLSGEKVSTMNIGIGLRYFIR